MDTANSADVNSKRSKAIIYALSKRLAVGPKYFVSESDLSCDFTNVVTKFFQSSAEDASSLKHQDEVMKWANFASSLSAQEDTCHEALKYLNEELTQKSLLLGGLKPSVADIIVFSALHGFVSRLSNEEKDKYPNVIRWMDYIQNKEDFGGVFDVIAVNKLQFEHFGSVDILAANQTNTKNVQSSKCVEKSDEKVNVKKEFPEIKTSVADKASIDSNKASMDSNKAEGTGVKVSAELNKKNTQEKKKPSEESSEKETECPITILNLQVGLILKAWKHPSADSLLVEEIDLGDGSSRQVVSGLAKYYSPEDLTNRRVVLITNVKPGKLRDVMSSGLVLCASNKEHTAVEPLTPPEGAKIGESISFSGFEGKPEDVLNPKKKQLDKITPHLYTDDKGVATYKGIPFMTSVGPCTASLSNASIK